MVYNVLHSFNDTDGAAPYGGIMQAANGLLYGMTNLGGKYSSGVIFSYDIKLNKYSTLVNLNYPNGTNPYGSFIQANNGLLYAMTYQGGTPNQGTIISFNTITDTDSVVYNFDVTHGANPYGNLIQAFDGDLFGMTAYSVGGDYGEIFRFNITTSAITVPVVFEKSALPQFGYTPQGGLTQTNDTLLYGMTKFGGSNNYGTLFRYDTLSTEDSVLVNLNSSNGIEPTSDLLEIMTANIKTANNPCYGDSSGWAVIKVRGGHYPLTYTWSNGASTDSISGLKAGLYSVTVRDAKGIYYSFNFNITQPSKVNDEVALFSNITCNGANNGKIVLAVSGGVKPYQYLWSPVIGTTDSLANLAPGAYTCRVTDSNNCISSVSFNITQPAVLRDSTISVTNATCYGTNNGSANIAVTGGTKPYKYNWSGGGGTNANAINLFAGTYTCTVNDSNGCVTKDTITVTSPTQIIATTTYTATPCSKSNGTASVSASGGISPYSYLWQPGSVSTPTDTGLAAGSYTCTITDSNSCIIMATVYVPNIGGPHDSVVSLKNVSCYGYSNGAVKAGASGGTPPYTYSWYPSGGTSDTAMNLAAGTYTFTTKDNTGCIGTAVINITQPLRLTDSIANYKNVTCYGDSNGMATVGVLGGTAPYMYAWSDGRTTSSISSILPGTYSVIVQDANKCKDSAIVTITSPSQLNASVGIVANKCGFNNGSASVNMAGGTSPYTYLWSPGGSTNYSISNVKGGTYTCTVKDSFKCADTVYVIAPDTGGPRDSVALLSNVGPCYGDKNGAASVTMLSASGAYSFLWAPKGGTGNIAFNLPAGTYTCTITDTTGCTGTSSVTITQPPQLVALMQAIGICFNSSTNDGFARINVTGGYPPYTYSWSNSATTMSIDNLSTGAYFCTVTDTAGCSAIKSCNILKGTPLKIDSIVTHTTSCPSCSDGWIKVIVSGGIPPGDTLGYTYLWTSSSAYTTTDTVTIDSNLAAGTYTLAISTSCTSTYDSGTIIVTVPLITANNHAVKIFPVPSAGKVYMVLPQMLNAVLDITNELGVTVYSKLIPKSTQGNVIEVDLSALPDGIYLARITSNEGVTTKKIVLQK